MLRVRASPTEGHLRLALPPHSALVPAVNPVTWTDASGNFWLFGGYGYDGSGDHWLLERSLEIHPVAIGLRSPAVPPTQLTSLVSTVLQEPPSASNMPGGRQEAVGWADAQRKPLALRRRRRDSVGTANGILNDLWEYNIANNQWTYVMGAVLVSPQTIGIANQTGVYEAATW